MLLLGLTDAGAQSNASIKHSLSTTSIIDIPVRLSLESLISAAEKALPSQVGNWRAWKDWHGIKSQYRAWRGPLNITVYGDVLWVQAHIRYWIKVHKKLLGVVKLRGSCGVDEPPRQALIGMQIRLGLGPDWSFRPKFHLLPTWFLDRCEMTIANIDVTPLVEKEFRRQMQNSLRAALRKLAPGINAIQRQAQRTWLILQEPIELGQDNWLMLKPAAVALSRIAGRGKYISMQLAVILQPVLVTGSKPTSKLTPLPPLGRYFPRSAGLNLQVAVNLDFATLNQRLCDALVGKFLLIMDRKASIAKLNLAGSGQKIRVRMELTGELAGIVELRARVAYDAQARKLEFHDLMFDYDAEDLATDLLAESIHEHIRQVLESAANQALAQYLDRLSERLVTVLKKITPERVTLDISALRLRTLRINIIKQGIELDGTATGSIRLALQISS